MTYSDLFENFWLSYGASESLKTKGSKRKAWECWGKIGAKWSKESGFDNHDEAEFARHVRRGYDAVLLNRKAAKAARQFVPQLPHLTTWLNEWRFDEEQETSTSEYRGRVVERVCDCGSTHVRGRAEDGGWICEACNLEDWKAGRTAMKIVPTLAEKVVVMPKLKEEDWRGWSIRYLSTLPVGRKLLERYGL